MDEKKIKKLLIDGAVTLGVDLSPEKAKQCITYLEELKAWNKKINLTAITSDKDIIIKHFLDSLTVAQVLKKLECKRLLDIGSGAGFPGIPLKIACPELSVLLMDSVEKKVHFMRHIVRVLNLPGIAAEAARAEAPSIIDMHRAGFDAVVSRAFSSLSEYIRIALPYVCGKGVIIAVKGPAASKELKEIEGVKDMEPPVVHEVKVPFSDRITNIIVIRKK